MRLITDEGGGFLFFCPSAPVYYHLTLNFMRYSIVPHGNEVNGQIDREFNNLKQCREWVMTNCDMSKTWSILYVSNKINNSLPIKSNS